MKIAYNPKTAAVITTATAANNDILFDLNARKVWAKGIRIGADWADISSKPSSLKNPYSLTTFGVVYDGSAAKTVTTSNFISLVNEAASTVTDGTMFITSYASNSGFADTNAINVPYKRKAIHLWEYVKAKTDSLYATKSHNHDDRYVRTFGTSNDNIDSDWGLSFKTFDPIPSGTPPELNPNISLLSIGNSFNRRKLLAFTYSNDNIYYRRHVDGSFTNWRRLAFANEIPTSLKSPYALTISLNGTSQGPYDGSAAKNINITPSSIGAAVSNHNHDYLVVNTADDKSFNSAYHNFLVLYAGGGNGITGKPANVDAFGLFKFRVASGWSGQMLLSNRGSLYIRSSEDAKMTNTLAWKTILDSSNYSGILDSRYYTESEVNNLLSNKLDRVNLTTGSWNPRGYNLAADYYYHGGDLSISENGGKMYVFIDGLFYQNEGLYRVLDTSDVAGLKNNLTVHLFLSNTDTTWYPLIWGGDSHNNTSDSTGTVYKSYDKLSWLTSSLTLYATHLKTTDLNTLTALFHPDNDSTLKIYSGRTLDAVSDGHIGLLTSIDGTDGLTHVYPTLHGPRCVLALLPRGGSVYIGNMPNGGNGRKLNVNGDIGLFNVGSIRDLTIGGGIYWNPYVESTTDSSDAASITVIKSGVAGGTTLVLSLMSDTNDTILFKTNNAARLYHNNNFILTSKDTKVTSGKGYINNTEITLVDNADKLDGWHKDNILWTGYITSDTANLQSYWFKMYDVTITSAKANDVTITFLVSDGFSNNFSIFYLKVRQNGDNGSGTYNLSVTLKELVGNLKDKIVAYYNNKTGNILLWGNAGSQWGVLNYTILKKTYRTDVDFITLGTLTAQKFTSVQTQPTTDYTKVTMSRVGLVQYAESSSSSTLTTKLQTARNLWGNSFDGTKDINGSIIFPVIGDTATSNKISWSGSSDGADIYYLTTATDLGNLVLNVKDDTNAYILLALNGTFKSHFDVANSYWTGRSAQADKWTTARTFTIGNTAKNVDGSGNVSWSLAEIGVRDTWRSVQVNGTSIGNNTLNLCGSTYIGLTNVNGKVTFSLVGSGTTVNQAILSDGTANGWTLKTLNIANWDTAYNFVSTITGEDADKVINKWDEIVNFLAGITEDNKLNTLLNSKLSILLLSTKDILTTKTNNALFWVNTKGTASSITTGPFTDHPYALLSVTNYNLNAENNKFFYRSRLAFSSAGDIKVASCHHENEYKLDETWYNVLTSKNSGINGSTIKLNGTSITVYSSGTADGRYVKKSGDSMTGALNFANNIWNQVGDDVAIGDHNIAGCLGIKGLTASPGLAFYNSSNTLLSKLVGTANLFLRVSGNNTYNILDTSTTLVSDGKGIINGTTITQVDNADKLDGYHENSFLRYRGVTSIDLEVTLWNLIGIKTYLNALPDDLTGVYNYGSVISLSGAHSRFEIYASHLSSSGNGLYYRSGWDSEKKSWLKFIDSSNIGSLSVNYANSAGNADTLDNYHANGLLTALSNSNRGISLTVGGTTKSLSNISVGDADTVDGKHATAFLLLKNNRFSQYQAGNWTKILKFNIPASSILSSISFTWHPSECARDVWADFSINIRSGNINFYGLWKSHTKRTLKCVGENGEYSVWVKGNKNSWDPYGVIQITQTWDIISYEAGSLAYQDTTPTGTSSADVTTEGYVLEADTIDGYHASNLFTGLSNSGNSIKVDIGGTSKTLQVNYANSAGSATKVIVNLHTTNDTNYPLVWSNLSNTNNATENQLYKSWLDLYYNPKNKRLFVKGSINTANINATGTVTSAGFKHSAVTENANLYVLTADGGYTFLNLASNELAHEFSKDITVTSEWTDIEDFYGGNLNFLTLPGTYIVLVYYNDNSADGMYEGYFSGIMSWFTGTTNSNNADEIVLHRVGHAYANTIYLRTRESLESETNPYTKLQISANTTLKQHTYKFKFKRIC